MKLLRLISLSAFFLVLFGGISAAQTTTDRKARKSRLEREIRILEDQISENSKRSNTAAVRLNLLQEKIKARRELLSESERELRVIHDSLYVTQKQINRLQARLDTMTFYYGKLVRNAYLNRDSRVWYMYILASENIGQAGRRFGYLRSLSTQMNAQAAIMKEAKANLEEKRAEMSKLRDKAAKVRSAHQSELEKLQKEQKTSKSLVAQLGREKKRYQGQIEAKRKEVKALQKEIERLIAKEMGSSKGKTASKKVAVDYTLSKLFSENKGKLPWPVEGRVVEHYGEQTHPVYKNIRLPFNNGISIAVPKDAEVKAVFDGVVKSVIVMPGYNQCLLVQHGDYFTFYCKLGSVLVKSGDKVKTGQTIGRVTTVNGETQLHFQLWDGRTPCNPEGWLR